MRQPTVFGLVHPHDAFDGLEPALAPVAAAGFTLGAAALLLGLRRRGGLGVGLGLALLGVRLLLGLLDRGGFVVADDELNVGDARLEDLVDQHAELGAQRGRQLGHLFVGAAALLGQIGDLPDLNPLLLELLLLLLVLALLARLAALGLGHLRGLRLGQRLEFVERAEVEGGVDLAGPHHAEDTLELLGAVLRLEGHAVHREAQGAALLVRVQRHGHAAPAPEQRSELHLRLRRNVGAQVRALLLLVEILDKGGPVNLAFRGFLSLLDHLGYLFFRKAGFGCFGSEVLLIGL
mmetsp:Transcript_68575/g.155119  ORF Transcript_68575/g.155119 Transcript_68575/m.155119 type:complete len:292 (+) Transcript_68575:696-1571(+)